MVGRTAAMVTLIEILGIVFVALILAGIGWYALSIYNRLVRVDERCENTWSDIDVVLKQRQDTLEKLVDTAQQAMTYERETLQQLVEAREATRQAETPGEHADADTKVREALSALNIEARAEAYPDLEAVDTLQTLAEEIATLEETIADRRELYNEAVTAYNTIIRQIPYVLVAGRLGFERRELFEAPPEELEDVDVSDLFGGGNGGSDAGSGSDSDADLDAGA